jgi:3-deoxy-7-phosphoheptulonate synthase
MNRAVEGGALMNVADMEANYEIDAKVAGVVQPIEPSGFCAHEVISVGHGATSTSGNFMTVPQPRGKGVSAVREFTLVSREAKPTRTCVDVGGVCIGGETAIVIAGPCSVESLTQLLNTAIAVKKAGATILRGGAYKPRTSPYEFQGLGIQGLRMLRSVRERTGLPVVTEVLSTDDISLVAEYADMLQVGARNMQNFALLRQLAKVRKPILLKRGASASIKEWMLAAEYLLSGGNPNVVLCERGIKSFDTETRNTLDLVAVALVRQLSHLPVIVDPSHATGRRDLIAAASRAALAIGADGLIVEVHPYPEHALSDGIQSLDLQEFAHVMSGLTAPIKPINSSSPRAA